MATCTMGVCHGCDQYRLIVVDGDARMCKQCLDALQADTTDVSRTPLSIVMALMFSSGVLVGIGLGLLLSL